MIIGIVVDNSLHPPLGVYAATTIVAIVLLVIRKHPITSTIAVALASLTLGGTLHDNQTRRLPPNHIAFHFDNNRTIARITGTVITEPTSPKPNTGIFGRWTFRSPSSRFILNATSIQTATGSRPITGMISVSCDGVLDNITPGQRVTVLGTASHYNPPANPGAFEYRKWQQRRGIHITMRTNVPNITVNGNQPQSGWRHWIANWRNVTRQLVIGSDSIKLTRDQQLVETMVLGRRYASNPEMEDLFRRTGLTHYLSVSGAHVGVVAWFLWLLTRLTGQSRRVTAVVVLIALILFAALVDPRPPIFRATIIGIVFCTGITLRRHASSTNSLAIAAIILLTIRPTMLFEPGFQMSFAAVMGVIHLRIPVNQFFRRLLLRFGLKHDDFPTVTRRQKLKRFLVVILEPGVYGIAASLAATPFVAWHFDRIAPLAPLASLLVFPLFSLTLFLGVLTIITGVTIPIATPIFQYLTNLSAHAMLLETTLIDRLTPTLTGTPSRLVMFLYFAIIIIALTHVRYGAHSLWSFLQHRFPIPIDRWRTIRTTSAIIIFSSLALSALLLQHRPTHDALTVTHLAVGAGTASIIQFPDGKTWVYDCGSRRGYDVGSRTLIPFCRHAGIRKIDRIIISHPNLDHFSGVLSLVEHFPTGPVTINHHYENYMAGDSPDRLLLAALNRRNHPIDKIENLDLSRFPNTKIDLLWPPADLPESESANESSTVLKITHQGQSILITGDIEQHAMAQLLQFHAAKLPADILVLPHHGSLEKNTSDFIAAVNPKICIRSTHQPLDETSAKLLTAIGNRPIFSTADHGAVSVRLDESGITATAHWPKSRPPLHIPHTEKSAIPSINP